MILAEMAVFATILCRLIGYGGFAVVTFALDFRSEGRVAKKRCHSWCFTHKTENRGWQTRDFGISGRKHGPNRHQIHGFVGQNADNLAKTRVSQVPFSLGQLAKTRLKCVTRNGRFWSFLLLSDTRERVGVCGGFGCFSGFSGLTVSGSVKRPCVSRGLGLVGNGFVTFPCFSSISDRNRESMIFFKTVTFLTPLGQSRVNLAVNY